MHTPSHTGTILNVLLAALLGALFAQVSHEGTHALLAIAFGSHLDVFQLFAMDNSWPSGQPMSIVPEIVITGGAAILNIAVAATCIIAFRRIRHPLWKLTIFYVGMYSLFTGFGYLLIDPLIASADSPGDWAFVVQELGGSWAVRIPIILMGAAGTLFGYLWMGSAAEQFRLPAASHQKRATLGLILCIYPYIAINVLFTLLGVAHPLGILGMVVTLMQYWAGFSGFIWAYLLRFQWGKPRVYVQHTELPSALNMSWTVGVLIAVGAVLAVLLPGVYFA